MHLGNNALVVVSKTGYNYLRDVAAGALAAVSRYGCNGGLTLLVVQRVTPHTPIAGNTENAPVVCFLSTFHQAF